MRYSLPLNIVRYANGTLVKLTASATDFISYDYDPDQETGTYTPTSIVISAKLAGNLTYNKWQYRKDGGSWIDIPASNDLGITITSNRLTILPTSSLFDKTNSYVLFRCVATDNDSGEEYTDTIEIGRIVDYIILYRKQQTQIDQDAGKIALIASDEQLRQYEQAGKTVVTDLASVIVTANGLVSTVAHKVGDTEIISKINQSAELIKISASKVNIEGATIFTSGRLSTTSLNNAYDAKNAAKTAVNNLKNDLASASGTTVINGGHIKTGIIDAELIQIGTLEDASSKNNWNLETGQFVTTQGVIANMTINKDGLQYNSTLGDMTNLFEIDLGRIQMRRLWRGSINESSGVDIDSNVGIDFYFQKGIPSNPWFDIAKAGSITPLFGGIQIMTPDGGGVKISNNETLFYDNVKCWNDLHVYGTKSRVAQTEDYGERLLYCYETPTPLFGDIGEAILDEEGLCYIDIDDIFSETITTKIEYQVFLQKEGPGDCWIADKQSGFFVIQGTPGLKVAWELKAKQADYRLERLELKDNGLDEYTNSYDQDSLLESYIKEQEDMLYG